MYSSQDVEVFSQKSSILSYLRNPSQLSLKNRVIVKPAGVIIPAIITG